VAEEETGMITIRKAVVSRIPPSQVQAVLDAAAAGTGEDGDPAAARLRDLALNLAAHRDLQVSVITYEDGRAELQVLHAGPPHYTEQTIDCSRFAGPDRPVPGWVVSLAGDGDLESATDRIRDTLLGASEPDGHEGRDSRSASSARSASARSRANGT
jgi:hypothetical protein